MESTKYIECAKEYVITKFQLQGMQDTYLNQRAKKKYTFLPNSRKLALLLDKINGNSRSINTV